MQPGFIIVELSNQQADEMALCNKYLIQFRKLIEKKVLEPEFTGQVILDILNGQIKNLKRDETWHY